MDLSKPSITSGDAGPARDEANALSANESSGTAGRDPANGKEVEAAPGAMRRPLKVDHTTRPYPIFGSNREQDVPITRPLNVDPAGNCIMSNDDDPNVAAFSNPVVAPVDERIPAPQTNPQMGDVYWPGLTRRQKRRENAKERKKIQNEPSALIKEPEAECSSGRKRSLTMTADSSQNGIELKRSRVESQEETPSNEKVAIIPVAFPAEQMLQNHIHAIQEAIMTRLVDTPDPLPRVTCGNLVGGALYFNCAGRDSVSWLSATISEKPIAGLHLKVVDAKDLPRPIKMAWKTKIIGAQDIKLMFRVLQRFNPGLNTDQWKVLDTSLDQNSSRRIILMDRASADVIKDAGYCLYSGIDISTFKLLEDSGPRSIESGPRDAPGDPP